MFVIVIFFFGFCLKTTYDKNKIQGKLSTTYGTKTVNGVASDDKTRLRDGPSKEACKPKPPESKANTYCIHSQFNNSESLTDDYEF